MEMPVQMSSLEINCVPPVDRPQFPEQEEAKSGKISCLRSHVHERSHARACILRLRVGFGALAVLKLMNGDSNVDGWIPNSDKNAGTVKYGSRCT